MEVWKYIKDYEGLYAISNKGRVMSFHSGKERILKFGIDTNGYRYVQLSKNGIQKNYLIHRLVAEAFIDNQKNLPCVNHKDENKKNNKIENLEWCTQLYNIRYGKPKGRKKKAVISINKVTGDKVRFNSIAEAQEKGYDIGAIVKCCKGERKTHKECYWEYIN